MNTSISAIPGLKHRQLEPFSKERGEDAAVTKAGLGITLGHPICFQLPQFSHRCPAPASVLGVTLSPGNGSESLKTIKDSALAGKTVQAAETDAGKPELLFPRILTESAPNGSQCTVWEWFAPPRTPGTPTAVQMPQVLLCSCRHPFALHPAHRLRQLIQARLSPCLHCLCISYHICKNYGGTSFENSLYPIGMLFRKMRKISLRLISHC